MEDILNIIRQNGLTLRYVPTQIKNNKEVVLAAVRENGYALE
jgi:hypothetical protein